MRKHFSEATTDLQRKMKIIGLSGMTALALTVYFFTGFFNSYVLFALLLCVFTGCYFCSRAVVSNRNGRTALDLTPYFRFSPRIRIEWAWCLALISLVIGYAQGSWRMGNLIDLVAIVCGLVVILDAPKSSDIYSVSMKIMGGVALFYAVSIWIQIFFPGVYELYLNALNNGSDMRLDKLTNYSSGFTTSPGHTASYLALGMCVYAQDFFERKWRTIVIEGFLLLSLFFTGMRMPVLAVGVCIIFFASMIIPVEKRKKVFALAVVGFVAAVVVIFIFRKPLNRIPVFHRTLASVQALIRGEDVSSGRMDLYRHAFSLFAQHPIFGIGWGNYRETVVGVITQTTPFEVHNIFLQLLCETGLVGCVCFVIPMVYTLVQTVQYFNQLLKKDQRDNWTKLMGCSCLFQIFFLLFGMTDNVLYYTAQEICYLVCCSVPVSYAKNLAIYGGKRKKQSKKKD